MIKLACFLSVFLLPVKEHRRLWYCFNYFFVSFLRYINQRIIYFSSISWTKYKMIIYQRYGCVCMSIFIFHIMIILYYVYKNNINICKQLYISAIHPTPKEVSFLTFIVSFPLYYTIKRTSASKTYRCSNRSFQNIK